MGFRVPGTEIPGTPVPGTANPRDSWDLGQISLGVPGTGTVKFCCPTALGQFDTTVPGTISDRSASLEKCQLGDVPVLTCRIFWAPLLFLTQISTIYLKLSRTLSRTGILIYSI